VHAGDQLGRYVDDDVVPARHVGGCAVHHRRLPVASAGFLLATAIGAVAVQPFAAAVGTRPRLDLPYLTLPGPLANPIDWVDVWLTRPDLLLFRATTSYEAPHPCASSPVPGAPARSPPSPTGSRHG
jgi:hypothetical protein